MDKKKIMLLVGALIFAAITALLARNMFAGASAPKAEAKKEVEVVGTKVLVATRSLPVGTIITQDSLQFQPWPKNMVEEAYFKDGEAKLEELAGTVVRNPITAGQPVTQGALVKPGDRGFLAAALGPGMRAVTIPVSALTGVAGFVFPGDRVDLILSQKIEGQGPALEVSETIIRNMRVLATDNLVSARTNKEGQIQPKRTKYLTMEATPQIAEQIAVAQRLGKISLALRSIADSQAELEQQIASGKIKIPTTDDPAEEARIIEQLAARPSTGATTYSTGGDVSRFEPRRPPALKEEQKPPKPPAPKVVVSRGTNEQTFEFGD